MPRVAVPDWNGLVSPVLDVARRVRCADRSGTRTGSRWYSLRGSPETRARTLREHDVNLVICCGISPHMVQVLAAAGIDVVPGVCGDVDRVLCAFAEGRLDVDPELQGPGLRTATQIPRS
jgi:hypothetical protein